VSARFVARWPPCEASSPAVAAGGSVMMHRPVPGRWAPVQDRV